MSEVVHERRRLLLSTAAWVGGLAVVAVTRSARAFQVDEMPPTVIAPQELQAQATARHNQAVAAQQVQYIAAVKAAQQAKFLQAVAAQQQAQLQARLDSALPRSAKPSGYP